MSVIVVGCGRSGTNMALEILRGSPALRATERPETKDAFRAGKNYPDYYLTKCDTCYINEETFRNTIKKNPDLKIVWTIRDPRDMLMSKLYRGRPKSQGGDCDVLADDGTFSGAKHDIMDMYHLYEYAQSYCPDRVYTVKMEAMLANTEREAKAMCKFLDIDYHEDMPKFWDRMRNKKKAERYKGKDLSQIGLWKDAPKAYDGHFADLGRLYYHFEQLNDITMRFGYEQ